MEVIGTPGFNYLDGWVNSFGNIVYVPENCTNMSVIIIIKYQKGDQWWIHKARVETELCYTTRAQMKR